MKPGKGGAKLSWPTGDGRETSEMSSVMTPESLPAAVGAVGPVGVDVGVVNAVADVELGVASRGRGVVAFLGAGEPPAAGFPWVGGVAQVHNHVELVILRVGRTRVGGAGGKVGEVAVDPPQAVAAAAEPGPWAS